MLLLDTPAAGPIGAPAPRAASPSPANDRTADSFNAVLLYEDPAAARHASTVSLKLAAGLRPHGCVSHSAWRFDLLDDANCRAVSLAKAAGADAVIVSSGSGTLPPAVESWLDACLGHVRDAGLILILLSAQDGSWTISIQHAPGFGASSPGDRPGIDRSMRCGYRAPLPQRRNP